MITTDIDEDALVAVARAARRRAHAPYSGFQVGAALQAASGQQYRGVNVESAAFPAGTCAERAALASAVTAGERTFVAVAVAGPGSAPVPPCGVCRQALAEFGLDLLVIAVGEDGPTGRWRLRELLPHAFVPSSLESS